MEEKKEVVIVCLVLLAVASIFFYFTIFYSGFNFKKSEVSINGNIISEKLYYEPNKPYHTLFRNFKTPIRVISETSCPYSQDGCVEISSVSCSEGQAYARDYSCYTLPEKTRENNCPYTEPNEYGCTFGDNYGFIEGEDYWIQSSYSLKPNNLFKINGKYYIKFVAYSKNKHPFLIKNKNLILDGNAISKSYYLPIEDVIIYIPYTPESIINYNIIARNNFGFQSSSIFFMVLIFISPAIIFFLLWYFFGKENVKVDLPPEMSFYPRERKGWEVAAFFNPPFSAIDKNFFSAIMLDFYRRKIIDTKMKEKEIYIKINEAKDKNLDAVERKFLRILKIAYEKCPDKHKEGEYFNLKKASSSFWTRNALMKVSRELQKEVKKEGKKYIESKAVIFSIILLLVIGSSSLLLKIIPPVALLFFLVSLAITIVISFSSSILIRFKGENYKEYRHWQAFKRFLKYSSLKLHSHKGIVVWQQHLVYASALGVAKRVLKELRKEHLINEKQYNIYMGTYNTTISFATSSGVGAGAGGVGGGGVGGGGGGGR